MSEKVSNSVSSSPGPALEAVEASELGVSNSASDSVPGKVRDLYLEVYKTRPLTATKELCLGANEYNWVVWVHDSAPGATSWIVQEYGIGYGHLARELFDSLE